MTGAMTVGERVTVSDVRSHPEKYEVLIRLLEGGDYWCPGPRWVEETPIEDKTMPGTCIVVRAVGGDGTDGK